MDVHYTYLLLNIGSILPPLLLSFDKKVAFFKKWKAFFMANAIMLTFFIIWDVLFTQQGIWGFNDNYLVGLRIAGLPIEEWLFFICIPYASVFLYETFRCWIPGDPFKAIGKSFLISVGVLSLVLCVLSWGQWYTFFTCLFLLGGCVMLRGKDHSWIGWFAFSYLIVLIPFIIVNGVLTGIEFWNYPLLNLNPEGVLDQVVWYNNDHNMGIRIFSVPLDDTLYGMLMLGMNVAIYEYFLKRHQVR